MADANTTTRPAWVDDELFPFESRFLDVAGHRVHYVDEGTGPTLLLLHGNPTWSFVYRDVIGVLRPTFRCIALDYPGFGLSTAGPGYRYLPEEHADVVVAFIDALDLRDITLVMQDWGGPIGCGAVERRPESFERLVVANTWAWPITGDRHFELFSHLMGGPIGRALIRRFNLFVNLMVPAGHRLRKPTAPEMAHYRDALATPARRDASAVFPGQITGSRDFLAEVENGLQHVVELPALIVWGNADFAFRAKERQRWEAILPNHRTVIIEGAGHFVQSDAPERFAMALCRWHSDE
jgi:haloalkane dehalogenase